MHRSVVASLALVTLATAAFGIQEAWKRYYIGESALSLESPVVLGTPAVEQVEDPDDWVGKMTDYAVETDSYYLQITVFEGKDGKKADHKKLATVMADTIEVFAEDAYTTQFTASADGESGKITIVPVKGKESKTPIKLADSMVGKVDGAPLIRADVALGTGRDQSIVKFAMIGSGNTVYAIFGVSYPDAEGSVEAIDRIMKSVRFKKGL